MGVLELPLQSIVLVVLTQAFSAYAKKYLLIDVDEGKSGPIGTTGS